MQQPGPTECLHPLDWWTALIEGRTECGECEYCIEQVRPS